MRKMILMAAAILLSAAGSWAQDTPAAEVSAGYSYLRFGVKYGVNQNGANVSVAGNFNRWLGLVGDVGGYHKSEAGATFNTYTFMGGPRFSYRNSSRVTPFAQVLVGAAHGSLGAFGSSGSGNGFAYSAGGGVDLCLSKHFSLRPQIDYIRNSFSGTRINMVRGSFGIVFRFGNR
jgi:outer membrane protein with beta-barrel domain